ncbi:MAG TPA: hypothetical protein VJ302_00310 [Blastocatellia bacterium]|nr:hypothetical protein [Blastocatellia bacterium]
MTRMIYLLLICCLTAGPSPAGSQLKPSDSLREVKAVLDQLMGFSKREALASPDAKTLYTGEALKWSFPTFGNLTAAPDKIVLTDRSAIARYQVTADSGSTADVYVYLIKEEKWKVKSVRRLALTGLLEVVQSGLKAQTSLTDVERDTLANINLTLATDQELIKWLTEHKTQFDRLRELAASAKISMPQFITAHDQDHLTIAALLKELHLGGVELDGSKTIKIIIGGVTDNTVGYIYAPSDNPPQMDDGEYFWVEKVVDNWYLFRTT